MFALSGGDRDRYSETGITEETLDSGIRLRWQLMRGSAVHALWFEALWKRCGRCLCRNADIIARPLLAQGPYRNYFIQNVYPSVFRTGPLYRVLLCRSGSSLLP